MAAGEQEKTFIAISSLFVNALGRDFSVFLLGADGGLVNRGYAAQPFQLSEAELGQAHKALEACAPWGWSSAHEPELALRYMPLMTAGTLVGLLVCRPHGGAMLTSEEEE